MSTWWPILWQQTGTLSLTLIATELNQKLGAEVEWLIQASLAQIMAWYQFWPNAGLLSNQPFGITLCEILMEIQIFSSTPENAFENDGHFVHRVNNSSLHTMSYSNASSSMTIETNSFQIHPGLTPDINNADHFCHVMAWLGLTLIQHQATIIVTQELLFIQ